MLTEISPFTCGSYFGIGESNHGLIALATTVV